PTLAPDEPPTEDPAQRPTLTPPDVLFKDKNTGQSADPAADLRRRLIGNWMVNDIVINGISTVASGQSVYENWVFYENGVFALLNTIGTYTYTFTNTANSIWVNGVEYAIDYVNGQYMKVHFSPQPGYINEVYLTRAE
ncbi:MAG: hypothetical protein D6714_10210, partial [Bacteroidetes bacterium]